MPLRESFASFEVREPARDKDPSLIVLCHGPSYNNTHLLRQLVDLVGGLDFEVSVEPTPIAGRLNPLKVTLATECFPSFRHDLHVGHDTR